MKNIFWKILGIFKINPIIITLIVLFFTGIAQFLLGGEFVGNKHIKVTTKDYKDSIITDFDIYKEKNIRLIDETGPIAIDVGEDFIINSCNYYGKCSIFVNTKNLFFIEKILFLLLIISIGVIAFLPGKRFLFGILSIVIAYGLLAISYEHYLFGEFNGEWEGIKFVITHVITRPALLFLTFLISGIIYIILKKKKEIKIFEKKNNFYL